MEESGVRHSAATTSLMLLSAGSKETNKYFQEFLLLKKCRHEHYTVTQEFSKKKTLGEKILFKCRYCKLPEKGLIM